MTRIRSLAINALTMAALGSVAACTSDSGDSASAPPATPSPTKSTRTVETTTTVAPSSTAPRPSRSASASSTSGTVQCAESQLRASVKPDDVAGLKRHVVRLEFFNKSDTTCTLTGYPGAAIVDSSGKQVQQAKRVVGGPVGGTIEKPGPIALRGGKTAYAYLEGASTRERGAAQAGCDGPRFPGILVTPPNTRTPVPFTIGWPQCYAFDVHPVRLDT